MANDNEIISEQVAECGIIKGKKMNVERIDKMPFHERRGRKPNSEKADA